MNRPIPPDPHGPDRPAGRFLRSAGPESADEPGALPEEDLRRLLAGLTAVRDGDFGTRLPDGGPGLLGEIAEVFNGMAGQLSRVTAEVTRVAREVGSEGRLGGQAEVEGVSGTWRELTDSVNAMAGNLTWQVRNIAQVTTAGTEGRLGGQADVRDVSGTWRDLTDSVNSMAGNLTTQVRSIAQVATAVAAGRRGGSAVRRTCGTSPGPGGTSPTRSTRWPAT